MIEQDFDYRSHQLEMMDGDAIGFEDFRNCLRDPEIVNISTLACRPTLHWLKKALGTDKSRRPISILDIGSGGGMLRKIWKWIQRCGRETHLTGVVLNPWSEDRRKLPRHLTRRFNIRPPMFSRSNRTAVPISLLHITVR